MTRRALLAWIQASEPEQAAGDLRALYESIRAQSSRGQVAGLWQVLGAHPRGLEASFRLYRALMDDPAPLSHAQAEMIAVVVSATNGCGYCVSHRGPRLARALQDEALAREVARDYRTADLPARDRVLLDYAVALTCEPSERKHEDVERVREYGFDDAGLLRATEIVGLYAYFNRVANALGVPLEPGMTVWEYGSQR